MQLWCLSDETHALPAQKQEDSNLLVCLPFLFTSANLTFVFLQKLKASLEEFRRAKNDTMQGQITNGRSLHTCVKPQSMLSAPAMFLVQACWAGSLWNLDYTAIQHDPALWMVMQPVNLQMLLHYSSHYFSVLTMLARANNNYNTTPRRPQVTHSCRIYEIKCIRKAMDIVSFPSF